MFRFILGRLIQGLLVLLALYTITFFLAKAMPGEPFTTEKNVSETKKQYLRKLYGLDKPLWQHTHLSFQDYPAGDFGVPLVRAAPTTSSSVFPVSLVLGLGALTFAIGIGVPIGIISAKDGIVGWIVSNGCNGGYPRACIHRWPSIADTCCSQCSGLRWLGGGVLLIFCFPFTLLVQGYLARLTVEAYWKLLRFYPTAHSKGLSPTRVILKHALVEACSHRSLSWPAFAAMISGSFIVETIFQVPGIGSTSLMLPLLGTNFFMGVVPFLWFL